MKLFLKNLIFVLVVPGTVGVYIPLLLADGRHIASGPILYLSMVLLVTGAIVCGWCVMDFAIIGRGTPAPIDAPKKLVVRGPYRYVRNPMYMGVLTVLVGWAVMFRWVHLMFYTVLVWTVNHLFVVLYEEPHLRRQFGDEYIDYCKKVGRWLPRFP